MSAAVTTARCSPSTRRTARGSGRFPLKNLICGTPTVHGGRVYVFADGGGQVVAVDAKKGTPVWETRLGKGWGGGSPVASGKYLYLTMREGSVDGKPVGVAALEAVTGRPAWSAATGTGMGDVCDRGWGFVLRVG